MQRYKNILVFGGVVAIAIGATIILTGVFTDFDDPILHRNLLRLLTVIGVAALASMGGSVLLRTEDIDRLATAPARDKNSK